MSAEPNPKPVLLLKAVTKPKPTEEIGAPGLKEFGGFIQEEFVVDLRGQRGALRYQEMVNNCPAISAALTTMKNTALRAIGDGRVEPFSSKSEDVERAEFVQECLDDMCHSRSDMDTEALTMFEHGFAPLNIVYKRRGGFKTDEELSSRFDDEAVGWKKISLRAQESVLNWEFDEAGRRVLGMTQIPAPTYVQYTISIDRLALFRTSAIKGNPEGISLLRSAYFAWKFFKRGTTIGWVGAERDVSGIPLLRGPGSLFSASPSTDQASGLARLKQIGENVRNDEQACVLLPSDVDPETKTPLFTFELVSSPGTKVMDVPAMTRDQERQILMVLFSDFLLLGHEKIGTQALFTGRMGLYAMQLDSLLDRYDETLNRQLIPRLGLLNGWPMDQLPYYKHGTVSETALEELGKFLQAYSSAGGIMDPDLDAYVREAAGWPAPQVEGLDVGEMPEAPMPKDPGDAASTGTGSQGDPDTEPDEALPDVGDEGAAEQPPEVDVDKADARSVALIKQLMDQAQENTRVMGEIVKALATPRDNRTEIHLPKEVTLPPMPVPQVTVNVPEQKAADVHVHVPQQAAPAVTVKAQAPDVVVNVPAPQVTVEALWFTCRHPT